MGTVHPDDRDRVLREFRQTLENPDGLLNIEYRSADGLRWIAGSGRLYRDLEGKPDHMVGINIDITERKRAETDLRGSEERYKALFERSRDWVYLCDFEGRFLDANQAALDGLGYGRGDINGLTFQSLLTEDQVSLAFQTLDEVRTTGHQQKPIDFRVRRKDGDSPWWKP